MAREPHSPEFIKVTRKVRCPTCLSYEDSYVSCEDCEGRGWIEETEWELKPTIPPIECFALHNGEALDTLSIDVLNQERLDFSRTAEDAFRAKGEYANLGVTCDVVPLTIHVGEPLKEQADGE